MFRFPCVRLRSLVRASGWVPALLLACAADRPKTRLADLALDSAVTIAVAPTHPNTAAVAPTHPNSGPAPGRGIPFGLWHLAVTEFRPPFTGMVLNGTDPEGVLLILEAARKAKVQVILNMFVNPKRVQDPDGSFNLGLWQQRIDRFATVNLEPYIADGTLAGNMLLDEPHSAKRWNGKDVPFDEIEAAAQYSKRLWPGLPTLVRSDPVYLRKAPFKWVYLDAAWAQYAARKGTADQYVAQHAAAAKAAGLGLVLGLNVLDGGDGSSGWKRTKSKYWAMSASEVLDYGSVLVKEPSACAFFMWKYDREDTSYFAQPDIQAAIEELGRLAADRPTASCRVH